MFCLDNNELLVAASSNLMLISTDGEVTVHSTGYSDLLDFALDSANNIHATDNRMYGYHDCQ